MKFEKHEPLSGATVYFRLLRYLRPYVWLFSLSIVGFIIFSATEPLQAEILKRLVSAIEQKDSDARYFIPAMLIGLYVVRGLASFIGTYCLTIVSTRLVHDLRMDAFRHVMRLPTRFYDDNNSGHIIARIIFNTGQVTGAATDALKVLVREGFTVIGLLIYVFWLNWKMSLVFIAISPIIAIMVTNVGTRMRKLSKKLQDTNADLLQVCNEAVTGHRVVRSFNGEEYESLRFEKASNDTVKRSLNIARLAAMNTPVMQLVVILAMAVIVMLILQPHFMETMSIADYVAYLTAVGLIPKPLRALTEINSVIQRGIAAAGSVFEILDLPPEPNPGTRRIERVRGKIEVRNLTHYYPDTSKPALKGINFTIEPGQTVALVGRSGSGKSTLANLISRFYRHSKGEILIDGINIDEYDLHALREQFAVVTQSVILFNDSIANNIAYGQMLSKASRAHIEEAARKAHALDFIEQLPEKFDTLVGENGVKLSGGQKQRIAIARALLKDAPVLILDEATSALDNESEQAIQKALDEFMSQRTTLVIAHRLSTIVGADQILVMDSGEILERGTHKELIAKGGYYSLLYSQGFHESAPSQQEITPQPQ
jgi:subfamily B ATP-binding cassette protein MsbA